MYGSRDVSQERDAHSAETRNIGTINTPNESNKSKDLENFTMQVISIQKNVSPLASQVNLRALSPKAEKRRANKKSPATTIGELIAQSSKQSILVKHSHTNDSKA